MAWQNDAAVEEGTDVEAVERVRRYAERLTEAVGEVFPDAVIIVQPVMGAASADGLWNSFRDGLVSAIDPPLRIVDGSRDGLIAVSPDDFWELYDRTYRRVSSQNAVRQPDFRGVEAGFGLSIGGGEWGEDPEVVLLSPAAWQARLETALMVTDEYVWVGDGGAGSWVQDGIPFAYIEAIRLARELAGTRKALMRK
jgi:hypothetical protein